MRPWSQLSVNLSAVLPGESRSLGWGWHMLSPALFLYTFMGGNAIRVVVTIANEKTM